MSAYPSVTQADCGWITGHTYLAYGPLLNCAPKIPRLAAPSTHSPSASRRDPRAAAAAAAPAALCLFSAAQTAWHSRRGDSQLGACTHP